MEKSSALAVYLVVVIIILILALLLGIRIWSALVLALLIGWVILFFLTPQMCLEKFKDGCSWQDWIYMGIWIITVLILLFYILYKIFEDRSYCLNFLG